jgi:hypothetical protein
MPKLKPFDFTAIKNGDIDEAKKVILDLLQLYPRGANRDLHKHDYKRLNNDAVLIDQGGHEFVRLFASDARATYWGYSDEQVYYALRALGAEGTYLCDYEFGSLCYRHFGYYKGKRTRAGRRLALRVSGSWKRAIAGGRIGDLIFNTRLMSRDIDGLRSYSQSEYRVGASACVIASSEGEATALLQTMFGFAADIGSVSGWQQGGGAEAMASNMGAIKKLQAKKEEMQVEIARYEKAIENADTLMEAIEMYTMTSFGDA